MHWRYPFLSHGCIFVLLVNWYYILVVSIYSCFTCYNLEGSVTVPASPLGVHDLAFPWPPQGLPSNITTTFYKFIILAMIPWAVLYSGDLSWCLAELKLRALAPGPNGRLVCWKCLWNRLTFLTCTRSWWEFPQVGLKLDRFLKSNWFVNVVMKLTPKISSTVMWSLDREETVFDMKMMWLKWYSLIHDISSLVLIMKNVVTLPYICNETSSVIQLM